MLQSALVGIWASRSRCLSVSCRPITHPHPRDCGAMPSLRPHPLLASRVSTPQHSRLLAVSPPLTVWLERGGTRPPHPTIGYTSQPILWPGRRACWCWLRCSLLPVAMTSAPPLTVWLERGRNVSHTKHIPAQQARRIHTASHPLRRLLDQSTLLVTSLSSGSQSPPSSDSHRRLPLFSKNKTPIHRLHLKQRARRLCLRVQPG